MEIDSYFTKNLNDQNKKLTVDDFETVKVIGRGSYGKVVLVKKTDSDEKNCFKFNLWSII